MHLCYGSWIARARYAVEDPQTLSIYNNFEGRLFKLKVRFKSSPETDIGFIYNYVRENSVLEQIDINALYDVARQAIEAEANRGVFCTLGRSSSRNHGNNLRSTV